VMGILLYHDLVEIEAGDTYVHDKEAQKTKNQREKKGLAILKRKIPEILVKRYIALYEEYKECKTDEAKFANAIDKLDPIIHSLEKGHSWAEWDLSEDDVREAKERHMVFSKEFTEILEELIAYLRQGKLIKSGRLGKKRK
jgi:putative hydrolases of HD superfamily